MDLRLAKPLAQRPNWLYNLVASRSVAWPKGYQTHKLSIRPGAAFLKNGINLRLGI